MSTPNTQITLQQFIGVTDANGAFDVWTDIVNKEFKDNLANQEILGNPIYLPKATEIIGDNVPLEIPVIPGVTTLDVNSPMTQKPKLTKVVANLSKDYWGQLTFNKLDKKSSIEWSKYLGAWFAGLWKRKQDTDNMICMEALCNTCLAFGQYVIDPVVGGKGYSKEDYYDAAMMLVDECNDIVSKRSDYQLGVPADRVKIISSYTANKNIIVGENFMSAANLSLERFNNGETGKIMNYDNGRSIYLGKSVSETNSAGEQVYPKSYDFTNYSALIYQLDSFRAYGHEYGESWYPVNDITDRYSRIWRINALVYPGFEPLNLLVVNRAPTLAEINEARQQLRTEQVGVYSAAYVELPDIDQDTLDTWNAEKDRYATRVQIAELDGTSQESIASLLSNGAVEVTANIATSGNTRNIQIVAAEGIKGMSFDLASVKLYGGLVAGKVTIEPTSLSEIKLTSTDTLTATNYLTIDVLKDNKKYGVVFVKFA